MSKKVFLVTVLIVSLLLIGLMLLVADARNTSVLDSFSKMDQKLQETNKSLEKNIDSLEEQLKISTEAVPEIVTQFNAKATDLVEHIQLLKNDLIPNGLEDYNDENPEIVKNNAVFFIENGQYSEKGKQFLAKIEAYENLLTVIHLEFPKTNTRTFKLREVREGKDWLNYNFKDFASIVSHTKLTAMENSIKNKKEIIFNVLLTKQ